MLIIDMPMPKHGCEDCPLLSTYMICRYDGKFRDLQKYVNAETRPEWCPIVGVLPEEHGDLVDRSLLCADLVGVILSHRGLGIDEVIARQPAIIEAERKDE